MSKRLIEEQKPKQKPDLHVLNIILIIEMSKRPIIEQRPKQKPDPHLRKIVLLTYQQYHHSLQEKKASGSQDKPKNNNPESEHEPKGKPGRPSNSQSSHSRVRKDIFKETPKGKGKTTANPIPTPNPTPNPKHDTDIINSTGLKFWSAQNLNNKRPNLFKRGFRKHKTPNGSRMNKPHYLAEIRKMLNENTWLIVD